MSSRLLHTRLSLPHLRLLLSPPSFEYLNLRPRLHRDRLHRDRLHRLRGLRSLAAMRPHLLPRVDSRT